MKCLDCGFPIDRKFAKPGEMQCHGNCGRSGFTLIELLMVIAIIGLLGLLSTLAVVAINSARCRSGEKTGEACEGIKVEDGHKLTDQERCDEYKTDNNPPPYCLKIWGIEAK